MTEKLFMKKYSFRCISMIILLLIVGCTQEEMPRLKKTEANILFHISGYTTNVPAGDMLFYNETITNLVPDTSVDLSIAITIKRKDTGKEVTTTTEESTIKGSSVKEKGITLPSNTPLGMYEIFETVAYEGKTESESFSFEVTKQRPPPKNESGIKKLANTPNSAQTKQTIEKKEVLPPNSLTSTKANTVLNGTLLPLQKISPALGTNEQHNTNNDSINGGTAALLPKPEGKVSYVLIENYTFSPAQISVQVNTTVIWTNKDYTSHSVSGPGFESGPIGKNKYFAKKFTRLLKNATYVSGITDIWGVIEVHG